MTHEAYPQDPSQLNAAETLQAGAEFLDHFKVAVSPSEEPDKFIKALKQLDPRYKEGRDLVRWQLEADETAWPDDTVKVIMDAAKTMRMLEPETPLVGQFDAVIVLGGARQSNLDRTRYAMQAVNDGSATFEQLVVGGSSRELAEAERLNTANYAPGALTEYDLCAGAAKVVAKENPSRTVGVSYVEDNHAGTPAILESVIAGLYAGRALGRESRIAAVTTQIYQTSTALDISRIGRKFDIADTFAAGNPSSPEMIANRKVATYLSEVLRTLRAGVLASL